MDKALPSVTFPCQTKAASGIIGIEGRRFSLKTGALLMPSRGEAPCLNVLKTAAFTLVELLVVIVILAVLATLMVTAFRTMRAKSLQADCLGNLKQIATTVNLFATDNNGFYPRAETSNPGTDNWWFFLSDYLGGREAVRKRGSPLNCIANHESRFAETRSKLQWPNYGANRSLFGDRTTPPVKLAAVTRPSKTIMVMDGDWSAVTPFAILTLSSPDSHQGGRNILYADGHAEWWKKASSLNSAPYKRGDPQDAWSP